MKTLTIFSLVFLCFSFINIPGDKPIATYRVGAAKVTVWENKTEDGRTWKNFKVEKLFKKGDQWETTNSFNETELLQLRAALDKAISEESVETAD